MTTMKDIARLAKVSTSTVSHVINNSRFVSEEVRQKVMRVVDELNYTPSVLARSLKIKETKTIGMLVTASNNPFFAQVVAEVERYCHQQDYQLILTNTNDDDDLVQKSLQLFAQKQVDGVLLMCTESHFQSGDFCLKLPSVIMDWWPEELSADKIFENSELGGYLATRYLIEMGHQDIAILTGSFKKPLAVNRLNGYKKALQEANIPLREEWIIEKHFHFEGGIQAMQSLLKQKQRPTAVFACSDAMAVGAYQAAWAAGLQIPQDISIIGYDDIELAQYMSPPLTTIHQPKKLFAQLAVDTLLARIKNPEKKHRTFMLEPSLIIRSSVKRLTS